MNMNTFRKLVLIWMIAWLPVSGVIASVMPISGMPSFAEPVASNGIGNIETADSVAAASNTDPMSSLPCHNPVSTDSAKSGSCTHCVLCHLAISLMLPAIPELKSFAPSHSFAATPLLSHASFFPEPVSPPPRALAG